MQRKNESVLSDIGNRGPRQDTLRDRNNMAFSLGEWHLVFKEVGMQKNLVFDMIRLGFLEYQ